MPEWLSAVLAALQLSARVLVPVILATGVILFAPERFLTRLGLTTLVHTYRQWFGLAFLVSAAIGLTALATWVGNQVKWLVDRELASKRLAKLVDGLTHDEQAIIDLFLSSGKRTLNLPFSDPAVCSLVMREILIRASNSTIARLGPGDVVRFPFTVHDEAWDYLREKTRRKRGGGAGGHAAADLR